MAHEKLFLSINQRIKDRTAFFSDKRTNFLRM